MNNRLSCMLQGLEDVNQLQQQAYQIKQWLINNYNADPLAIREQRKRLNETLLLIIKTVKK